MIVRRVLFVPLALALALALSAAACGGGQSAPEPVDTDAATLVVDAAIPVTVRFCVEAVTESDMSAAVESGFVPARDPSDAVVSVGPIVSGTVAETDLDRVREAECVIYLERADRRILIAPEVP